MIQKYKSLSDWVYYFGQLPLLSLLPRAVAFRIVSRYSDYLCNLQETRRETILSNLRKVFPEASESHLQWVLKENYRTQAWEELETYFFPRWHPENVDRHFDFQGLQELQSLRTSRSGLVLFTGHIGSFTSAVGALGLKGVPLNYFAQDSPEQKAFHPAYRRYARMKIRWMEKMSQREFMLFKMNKGEESLAETSLRVLAKLRREELISLAIDVPPVHFSQVEEAEFLGLPCRFPIGFIHLVHQVQCPLVPFFTLQVGESRRSQISFEEEIELSGDPHTDLQKCLDSLSGVIRSHPGQWFYWDSLEHFLV